MAKQIMKKLGNLVDGVYYTIAPVFDYLLDVF